MTSHTWTSTRHPKSVTHKEVCRREDDCLPRSVPCSPKSAHEVIFIHPPEVLLQHHNSQSPQQIDSTNPLINAIQGVHKLSLKSDIHHPIGCLEWGPLPRLAQPGQWSSPHIVQQKSPALLMKPLCAPNLPGHKGQLTKGLSQEGSLGGLRNGGGWTTKFQPETFACNN
ncbi:hypothetical protein JTE90_006912 [Oedothorax gibbosus]|uniref:Uncharacterized protein n=1 Tax=Oedothorax gibbosus TaxID=931172 RepID=A0AAV6VRM5_9ARAC|nr:hypothetical protein JTE90_006912 [Oedothorax gibbosus]